MTYLDAYTLGQTDRNEAISTVGFEDDATREDVHLALTETYLALRKKINAHFDAKEPVKKASESDAKPSTSFGLDDLLEEIFEGANSLAGSIFGSIIRADDQGRSCKWCASLFGVSGLGLCGDCNRWQ